MSKKSIHILVVGAGSIGTRHTRNLLVSGYKNLSVCDPDKKRLETIKTFARVPPYRDVKTALKQKKQKVPFRSCVCPL